MVMMGVCGFFDFFYFFFEKEKNLVHFFFLNEKSEKVHLRHEVKFNRPKIYQNLLPLNTFLLVLHLLFFEKSTWFIFSVFSLYFSFLSFLIINKWSINSCSIV